jgi:hypothetical protein
VHQVANAADHRDGPRHQGLGPMACEVEDIGHRGEGGEQFDQ